MKQIICFWCSIILVGKVSIFIFEPSCKNIVCHWGVEQSRVKVMNFIRCLRNLPMKVSAFVMRLKDRPLTIYMPTKLVAQLLSNTIEINKCLNDLLADIMIFVQVFDTIP